MNWIEYVGYAASFFVVLSFVLIDIKKIRIVTLFGSDCFVVYGFLIDGDHRTVGQGAGQRKVTRDPLSSGAGFATD